MQNDFGGQVGSAEILIVLIFYGSFFAVFLGIQALICYFLQSAAKSIPEQYRLASPGQAWLLLIPLFNFIWLFIYTKSLSQSFQRLFGATNQQQGDCGEQVGMWWGICAIAGIVPCVNFIAGPAALVLMIIYLVKMSECKSKALYAQPVGLGSGSGSDYSNPYSTGPNPYSTGK